MEKYFQPTWMQTVTCLNALKSDDEYLARNLTKVVGEKRYLYSPAFNSAELDCIPSSPSQPAFSESEPSKSTPGPGGLHMWEPVNRSTDFPPTREDPSPLVKASCSLRSDAEAPSCTEVTESSWILRTLQRVTFSSSYLDLYHGYETVGGRYLYAPRSEISGFVDEGFPPFTQIHLDKEASSLKSEELIKTSCSTAAAKPLLADADERPVEIIQNHRTI